MVNTTPSPELLLPREVPLGGQRAMIVRRTLPHKTIRTVGAWCFVDDYGPADITGAAGMQVAPHPHTGLQTVSWLLDGEVLHRDSLGSEQLIRPGQLNLMTAGAGISHSEESPSAHSDSIRGVQLWVALPDRDRQVDPAFDHHADLPLVDGDGWLATVLIGSFGGARSPATAYTPIVGVEIALRAGKGSLDCEPGYEHAVLALDDGLAVEGVPLDAGSLVHLPEGRPRFAFSAARDVRLLLLGGPPLEEELLMWWNFVARDHDEIIEMRQQWEASRSGEVTRFGAVTAYDGPAIPAPEMPTTRLRSRPRRRG